MDKCSSFHSKACVCADERPRRQSRGLYGFASSLLHNTKPSRVHRLQIWAESLVGGPGHYSRSGGQDSLGMPSHQMILALGLSLQSSLLSQTQSVYATAQQGVDNDLASHQVRAAICSTALAGNRPSARPSTWAVEKVLGAAGWKS